MKFSLYIFSFFSIMAGMKHIKGKIASVGNIKKMTKALEVVSTIKLQKMKEKTEKYRDFLIEFIKLANVVHQKANLFASDIPDTKHSADSKTLLIVLSTDKGLCGAINSRLFKEIDSHYKDSKQQAEVYAVGKQAKDFFQRNEYTVVSQTSIQDEFDSQDLQDLTGFLHKQYRQHAYASIKVCFNYFHNPLQQNPVMLQLLPFDKEGIDTFVKQVGGIKLDTYLTSQVEDKELLIEPSVDEVKRNLMDQFIDHLMYGAMLQTKTGEFASRMIAMKNAKDNAGDLIHDLTLQYNKMRQGAITQEISEIVSAKIAME